VPSSGYSQYGTRKYCIKKTLHLSCITQFLLWILSNLCWKICTEVAPHLAILYFTHMDLLLSIKVSLSCISTVKKLYNMYHGHAWKENRLDLNKTTSYWIDLAPRRIPSLNPVRSAVYTGCPLPHSWNHLLESWSLIHYWFRSLKCEDWRTVNIGILRASLLTQEDFCELLLWMAYY
jgi:hypothetical protein